MSQMRQTKFIVFGDIHGYLDPLKALIAITSSQYPPSEWTYVFQELSDRGPDTCGVFEFLIAFKKKFPRTRFLLSNHDHEFKTTGKFLENGAESYPNQNLLLKHLEFVKTFKPYIKTKDFIFVHGGIPDGISHPKDFSERELASRYDPSRNYKRDELLVVGHTPVSNPILSRNVLYIDTGASIPGKWNLSAAVLLGSTEEKKLIEVISLIPTGPLVEV